MYRPLDPGSPDTFRRPREIDVLVPTRNRPAELAATLAGLAAQSTAAQNTAAQNTAAQNTAAQSTAAQNTAAQNTAAQSSAAGQDVPFGVVVSDQSDNAPSWEHAAVAGTIRILRHRGHPVLLRRHLPRRGLAEQRAFLLDQSRARYVLFLDDDVWLEPDAVDRMLVAIKELRCGFVGSFPHGLSYVDDHRPEHEKAYEEWTGRPEPERIRPRGPEWQRANLHAAANLLHLTRRLDLAPGQWRAYKLAWLGACVLYDRAALVAAGGYDFWRRVPPDHSGEDAAAQLRVLARAGGAGVLPSGAYHLETPTTVPDRRMECFDDSTFPDVLERGVDHLDGRDVGEERH